ncbi:hypothetical protein [Rhodoligotrophos ferricapiens]|uniref:hypothetical protein n=1 Tax=Rhodoligotrophos ferricapiens TaxID=3069264 RepID=UPI00315DD82F
MTLAVTIKVTGKPLLDDLNPGTVVFEDDFSADADDAAGVYVHARDRHLGSVSWDKMVVIGGIAIRVPTSQASDAAELMAEFQPLRHYKGWVAKTLDSGCRVADGWSSSSAIGLFRCSC